MRDMPSRVRLDPDYNGHQRQVVGWASDVPVDDEHGWTEYVRADMSDALLREAVEALGGVMTACDQGRMVAKTGVGGMTIEANIRGSVYMGVPAWPIEIARATLAKLRAHLDGETE